MESICVVLAPGCVDEGWVPMAELSAELLSADGFVAQIKAAGYDTSSSGEAVRLEVGGSTYLCVLSSNPLSKSWTFNWNLVSIVRQLCRVLCAVP